MLYTLRSLFVSPPRRASPPLSVVVWPPAVKLGVRRRPAVPRATTSPRPIPITANKQAQVQCVRKGERERESESLNIDSSEPVFSLTMSLRRRELCLSASASVSTYAICISHSIAYTDTDYLMCSANDVGLVRCGACGCEVRSAAGVSIIFGLPGPVCPTAGGGRAFGSKTIQTKRRNFLSKKKELVQHKTLFCLL